MAIFLVPGANALETAELVKAQLAQIEAGFPKGLALQIMYDTSEFVKASIEEVIHTFVEALILVLIVVFLFLQSWRATLIPMLAVPVSLVATFAAFEFLGFSINTLSLFGMVLAIGIVVDDAIVVVEAVEHNMQTHGLSPNEATRKSMDEVQGPVVAIALVLAAVFIPMAFIPGVTGQLYKQFAITVAVSTMFSALVALTLTPALCAMLLKPHAPGRASRRPAGGVLRVVQPRASIAPTTTTAGSPDAARAARCWCSRILGAVILATGGLQRITPTGFVPDEDKGAVFTQVILPEARLAAAHDRGRAPGAGDRARDSGRRERAGDRRLRPDLGHGGLERRVPDRAAEALGRAPGQGPACLDDRRQAGRGDAQACPKPSSCRSTRRRCRGSARCPASR